MLNVVYVFSVQITLHGLTWPDLAWPDPAWPLFRALHFAPCPTFSRFFELIPFHGMWIARQCNFSAIKKLLFGLGTRGNFLKILGEKYFIKIWFHSRFHIGGLNDCLDEGIPNVYSELSCDNIWSMIWPKHRQNIPESRVPRFFVYFRPKLGSKYYPITILRPYLESPHQGDPFRLPI